MVGFRPASRDYLPSLESVGRARDATPDHTRTRPWAARPLSSTPSAPGSGITYDLLVQRD